MKEQSFVSKGIKQIDEGKKLLAMQTVVDGCNYYTNKVVKNMNPYPVADVALIILSLRAVADGLEKEHPESVPLLKDLEKRMELVEFNTTIKSNKEDDK